DTKLVAQDAWIAEEGLPPRESVQIGAADADAMDSHERLTLGDLGDSNIRAGEPAGMLKGDLLHVIRYAPSRRRVNSLGCRLCSIARGTPRSAWLAAPEGKTPASANRSMM